MEAIPEESRRILIVEDESTSASAICGILDHLGYSIVGPVASGKAAIHAARKHMPDLALMDIRLEGGMTGIVAAQRIRNELGIPVIFLTAHADDATINEAKHVAPAGFLVKPIQPKDLKSAIEIATYKDSLERKVQEMESWRASVMKSLGDAVIVTDDNQKITFMNPAAEQLTGWTFSAAIERRISEVVHLPRHGEETLRSFLKGGALEKDKHEGRTEIIGKAGDRVITEYRFDSVTAGDGQECGRVLVLRDVTEREFTDNLTGLPNQAFFLNRLEHTLLSAHRQRRFDFSVFFIDIDRFRLLNESQGLNRANQALIEVGKRLDSLFDLVEGRRWSDSIVARLEADRFAVLVTGIKDPQINNRIARRIHTEFRPPITIDEEKLFLAASIGIAQADSRYLDPYDILRDAETAMKRAKRLGGERSEFFEPQMHAATVERWRMERSLRAALADGDLQLVYQPIIDLQTLEVVYFEALARWMTSDGRWISPSEFIPVAEETGLIKDIGEWTLEEATSQAGLWGRLASKLTARISVNVSALQITNSLVDTVSSILREGRLKPCDLQLEVTESSLIEIGDEAISVFHALKDLGVHLALDDFGTGYSSLSYLHNYPIDTLKIDRSFIIAMTEHKRSKLIDTIVMLANTLELTAVAEGIETSEQFAILKKLGCSLGQGYLFARPLSPEKALAFLNQAPRAPKERSDFDVS